MDARSCSERRCRYGAVCQLNNGVPECVCPATCQDIRDPSILHADSASAGGSGSLVCGSDSQTYGSACQLVLFACRLQKDITVAYYGPCQGNAHLHHLKTYFIQYFNKIIVLITCFLDIVSFFFNRGTVVRRRGASLRGALLMFLID